LKPEILLWELYGPLFSLEEREVFQPDTREIQFYLDIRRKYPGSCMELGAGDGRLTQYLQDGSQVIALEPSSSMLSSWPYELRSKICRIRAIAQDLPVKDSTLDLIIFPYNGIHCILEREDRKLIFREIASALKTDGKFLAETCPAFHRRPDEEKKERFDYENNGTSLKLVESVSHDWQQGLIKFDMEYSGSAVSGNTVDLRLELSLISAGELLSDMTEAGLRINSIWGDYDYTPWDVDYSPRLLVMAERI
jgi:SAM-dependent methyltransferase